MAKKKSVSIRIGVKKAPTASMTPPKNDKDRKRTFSPTKLSQASQASKPPKPGELLMRGKKAWSGPQLPKGHDNRPRWTPESGLTYSMISAFAICPQSFWRSHVAGYRELSDDDGGLSPIDFGNLFHHLSEKFFGLVPTKEQALEEAYNFLDPVRKSSTSAPMTKIIDRLAMTGSMIFSRHQEYWNETPTYRPMHFPKSATVADRKKYPDGIYDNQLVVIERERTFKIKHQFMPGERGWVWLRGKVDGIFDIPVIGERSILENKTKTSIDEVGIKETLHEDLQTNIYLYAAHRMGYPTQRVLYNVIRRPKHVWNQQKETLRDHVLRIEEMTHKEPDHFFKRFDRTVHPSLVEKFIAHTLNPLLYKQMKWGESIRGNPMRPWHLHDAEGNLLRAEDGSVVVNLEHYERPYGCYDPYAFKATGHQYSMRIENDYSNYRQIEPEELFPELDDESDAIVVAD